jgi:hypothetical protein
MAFYTDVQKSIRPVYLSNEEFDAEQQLLANTTAIQLNQTGIPVVDGLATIHANDATTAAVRMNNLQLNLYSRPAEKTALEICGEEIEKMDIYSQEQKDNYIRIEQGIIRSHVLHYITQMVNMKIPLDISKSVYSAGMDAAGGAMRAIENGDSAVVIHATPDPVLSGSMAQKGSVASSGANHQKHRKPSTVMANDDDDVESVQTDVDHVQQQQQAVNNDQLSIASDDSGYENGGIGPQGSYSYGIGEAGYNVWKFVSKFVDRVCQEGYLNETQKLLLHNNLTEVVSMQISTLEAVYLESKRIPPRVKPKLDALRPDILLVNEHVLEPSPLRCYLIQDGREDTCGVNGGPVLIPAEGALFLTNYRVIYRGIPVDSAVQSSDAIITRSFPIFSLIKEKKFSGQYHTENSNSTLHDGLQLRSCTFQLIRVYFDEEVSTDNIEKFRQMLFKLRYPHTILDVYALQLHYGCGTYNSVTHSNGGPLMTLNSKTKETKNSIFFKHFAKNTLRKAGLMPRNSNAKKISLSTRTPEITRKFQRASKNGNDANELNTMQLQLTTPVNGAAMAMDSDEESVSSSYLNGKFI